MTKNHPITPPPELVEEWRKAAPPQFGWNREKWIATQAARWAVDQELEACCVWLQGNDPYEQDYHQLLRAARRPSPLKEKVLAVLDGVYGCLDAAVDDVYGCLDAAHENIIRRALETPDD